MEERGEETTEICRVGGAQCCQAEVQRGHR